MSTRILILAILIFMPYRMTPSVRYRAIEVHYYHHRRRRRRRRRHHYYYCNH